MSNKKKKSNKKKMSNKKIILLYIICKYLFLTKKKINWLIIDFIL